VLRLRVLSAVVGVPILLALPVIGGIPYVIAACLLALVASHELYSMLSGAGHRPVTPVGMALTVAIVLSALSPDPRLVPALLVVAVVGCLLLTMRRAEHQGALVGWALTIASALYVGGTMHYAIPLRNTPDGNGLLWALSVLICTWACDIAAFFVGRRWGRARLAPRISPGKSVEGAVAGILLTVVVAAALGPLLTTILGAFGYVVSASLLRMAGLGFVIAVCAVAGDLLESFVKRQCGAKDSSSVIPGHGGVLDRMDSILTAFVGAYFYVVTTA
jgi:phosphatidate cytidylyltransferase